jgi:hypothetical protein
MISLYKLREKRMSERKVKYAKFFPGDCVYVSVVGRYRGPEDYDVSLDIGDGNGKASFFLSDFFKTESVAQLKALQEAVKVAIDFYEAASSKKAEPAPAAKKPKKPEAKK